MLARRSVAITGAPHSSDGPRTTAVGALHHDIGAHPHQLERVHEAVLEDGLGDDRGAGGLRQQRHHLRLQVGGKAGIRQRAQFDRLSAAPRATRSPFRDRLDRDAGLAQLGDDGIEMLDRRVTQ